LLGAVVDGGRLRILSVLGFGGFATVLLAVEIKTGSKLALKCLPVTRHDSHSFALQCIELEAHLRVNDHPNIITLHRIIEHDAYVIFVLDYCAGGDLQRPLEDTTSHQIMNNGPLLKHIFTQVLDAVAHCHSLGVYHRDLKPNNFLCSPDLSNVFLCDFGLATMDALSGQFRLGSKAYMSPECIREHIRVSLCPTPQSDVWSLGVMLYCFFTAHRPWSCAILTDEFYSRYERMPESLFEEYDAAPEVMNLIFDALQPNPYRRISIEAFRKRFAQINQFYCHPKALS
ncbi:kinase-like protein, partial [Vararia minispora EC-137]